MSSRTRRPVGRPPRRRGRGGAHVLSTLLFVAAIAFAGAAIYLYFLDDNGTDENRPPTAEPGNHDLASVLRALEDAGLEADYGRSPSTADSNQLEEVPGQHLTVNGQMLFAFIYPGTGADAVAAREEAGQDLDPSTMTLSAGTNEDRPIGEGEELHVFQGSNIIAVLVGGDDELVSQVQDAIENLP